MSLLRPSDGGHTSLSYTRALDEERREIRLLKVHEQDVDGLVSCELFTASLDDTPEYVALSYVWGDQHITTPILVDGTIFQATLSLELALRHVRHSLAMKPIWVDAICIDQTNIAERQQQVLSMRDIYSRALGTIIWAGQEDVPSEMLTHWQNRASCSPSRIGIEGMTAVDAMKLKIALFVFSFRPWWHRMWVVQEVLLSQADPIFYCGQHVFNFSLIDRLLQQAGSISEADIISTEDGEDLVQWVTSSFTPEERDGFDDIKSGSGMYSMGALVPMRGMPLHQRTALKFDTLRLICGGRKASVPHDYLYSLLGMLVPEEACHVKVDYCIPRHDLFHDFTKKSLISGTLSLEDFSKLPFTRSNEPVPSWVPDYAFGDTWSYRTSCLMLDQSGPQLGTLRFAARDTVMLLSGTFLGTTASTSPLDVFEDIFQHEWTSVEAGPHCACRPIIEDAIYMYLGPPNQRQQLEAEWDVDRIERIKRAWAIMAAGEPVEVAENQALAESGLFEDMITLQSQVRMSSLGTQSIRTDSGLRAVGCARAEIGDELVYLDGYCAPFLLRRERDHYVMVGAVRVAGFRRHQDIVEYCQRHTVGTATFRIG